MPALPGGKKSFCIPSREGWPKAGVGFPKPTDVPEPTPPLRGTPPRRGAFFYPLSGGVAEGRGGFPQAYRRSRPHPAATRHPSEEGSFFLSPLGRGGRRPGWVPGAPVRQTHPTATRHPSEEGMESGYHSLCQQTQEECSAKAPIPNNRFAAKGERSPPDRACCRAETRPPSDRIDLSHKEG